MISKLSCPGFATAMPSAMVGEIVIAIGSRRERERIRRRVRRLDADDPQRAPLLGRLLLRRGGDAGDEPSAADRDDEGLDSRRLLEDLEADRALARDDVRMVVGRHEDRAGALGELGRRGEGLVEDVPAQHHLRAVVAGRRELGQGDADGHEDGRLDAELARGEGDALRVVAG